VFENDQFCLLCLRPYFRISSRYLPPTPCLTLLYFTLWLLSTNCSSGYGFLFYMRFAPLWFRCIIPFRVFLISQQMYTEISFSQIICLMYLTIFRLVRKIAKSNCYVRHVCSSACPHGTSRLPLECSWNLILEYFSKNWKKIKYH